MAASLWRSFPCSRRQLRLDAVLLCGQSFRWREAGAGEWLGVLADRVWRLKQDETHLYYQVADCVCLMSLDKTGAIPVDTHVWQFAARHYLPKLQAAKSVTGKLYQEIGDHFRDLWGPYAGWAHSVLFTSELRHMQSKKSSPDQVEKPPAMVKQKRQSNSTEDGKGKAKYSKPSSSSKKTGRTA